MFVNVLGVGSALSNKTSTAFLVSGVPDADGDILIDCGYGVVDRLNSLGYDFSRLRYVALTHYHEDHISQFAKLIFTMQGFGYKLPTIILPLHNPASRASGDDADALMAFKAITTINGTRELIKNDDDVDITTALAFSFMYPFKVDHTIYASDVASAGYVIKDDETREVIMFTGDTRAASSIVETWQYYRDEGYTVSAVYHDLFLNARNLIPTYKLLDVPHATFDSMLPYYPVELLQSIKCVHYDEGVPFEITGAPPIVLAKPCDKLKLADDTLTRTEVATPPRFE